tara:strand:- start:1907 stop:2518 length:612 start_codon:yes stop_codon:yes gene_type:complete
MATIDELIEAGFNFYDPAKNVGNVKPEPKQFYRGHICDVKVSEVAVRKKYKAKVYNFFVELSDNKDRTYNVKDADGIEKKNVDGSVFKGKKYKASGVFQFLVPKAGDTFAENSGGNEKYLYLCESINAANEKVTVNIDGVDTEVVKFPDLDASDLVGKPIDALLDEIQWKNREGNTITSLNVKSFRAWDDGEPRDFELEDIPF